MGEAICCRTLFDTAPAYGQGRSEEVLGQALGPRRKDVVLVTKVGVTWDEKGDWFLDGSRGSVLREVEDSLRRLQTDYIDLLVVHRPDLQAPLPEVVSALDEVQRSGKARYVGVSNFTVSHLKESMPHGTLVANQLGYNLFDRCMEDVISWCHNQRIGVMAYGSLCYGLLTGCRTPREIEENVKTTGWSLSPADMAEIQDTMARAAGLSDQTWP